MTKENEIKALEAQVKFYETLHNTERKRRIKKIMADLRSITRRDWKEIQQQEPGLCELIVSTLED